MFAETTGDPNYDQVIDGWPARQIPYNPETYIDAFVGNNYRSFISQYISEASFGKFEIIGDYLPELVKIPYSTSMSSHSSNLAVFKKLNELCDGQQKQTSRGFNFPEDFDLWSLMNNTTTRDNIRGIRKRNIPDGFIDCVITIWRINSRLGNRSGGLTWHTHYELQNIANKKGVTTYGYVYSGDQTVLKHEVIHGTLGGNEFHSGGAGGGSGTFITAWVLPRYS